MSLTTQDYIDIQMLYARYNHAADSLDADAWAATFTPDATFSAPGSEGLVGTGQLVAFLKGAAERAQGQSRHWFNNLVVEPLGGGASGSAYFIVYMVAAPGTPPAVAVTGTYSDTLVKTTEGWKFAARNATFDG